MSEYEALWFRMMRGETNAGGLKTLGDLEAGMIAVIERLEYGATKHPDESWKRQTPEEHLGALVGHVEALKAAFGDRILDRLLDSFARDGHEVVVRPPCDTTAIRKHLAAIACRALFALTVDDRG